MTGNLTKVDFVTALKSRAQALGLTVTEANADGFKAEQQDILVKWPLGQRKVVYSMSVRAAEPDHTANFREMVKEKSWGLLPPTLSVTTTTQRGLEVSGTHTEKALMGGGGKVDFGKVRDSLKQAIADSGWTFHYEAGRAP